MPADFNFEQWARTMDERLERLEQTQRLLARNQRRQTAKVIAGIQSVVVKRAALLIGSGVLIGSALGSSAADLVRAGVLKLLGGP